MATIQDKNKRTTTRVDGNGYLHDIAQGKVVGRIYGGGIYDENGKLTGRYHCGKIYDPDGPQGGKVTGQYDNGKIYDENGYWGGNIIGYYTGDVFKEGDGLDLYRPPIDERMPTPAVADRQPAPPPQQVQAPATNVERTMSRPPEQRQCPVAVRQPVTKVEMAASRPPVHPRSVHWKGIPFLMSKCQHCGAPAKGRFYVPLLILTPFALLFYGTVIYAIADYVMANLNDIGIIVLLVSSFITLMLFLAPGLAVLYLLRRPKCVCDACRQRAGPGNL